MPSNHLILCCPLLLPSSTFPSIRVFSNESALPIQWPRYWSFGFSISPSNECSGLISYRVDWFDLLAAQALSGGCVAAGVGFRLGLFESVSVSDRSCDRGSLLHVGSLPSELHVEAPLCSPPCAPRQGSWALVPDSKPLTVGKLGSHLSTCQSPKAGTTAPVSLHTSPGQGRPSDPHSQMWF